MSALEELSTTTCLELLAQDSVARVALCTPVGPRIVPVNYSVHDQDVFFRTKPYTALGTYARDSNLAMEIDRLDYAARTGWSVVVLGRAVMVDDPAEVRQIRREWDPAPWVGGDRYFYIRLRIGEISGRRMLATPPTMPVL